LQCLPILRWGGFITIIFVIERLCVAIDNNIRIRFSRIWFRVRYIQLVHILDQQSDDEPHHVSVTAVGCTSVHHARRPQSVVLYSVDQWTDVERCCRLHQQHHFSVDSVDCTPLRNKNGFLHNPDLHWDHVSY